MLFLLHVCVKRGICQGLKQAGEREKIFFFFLDLYYNIANV